MKPSFRPPTEHTVADYDTRFHEIKRRGMDVWPPVWWVPNAPPVEALGPDRYDVPGGWIRVSDPEAYDAQMRTLVGLD